MESRALRKVDYWLNSNLKRFRLHTHTFLAFIFWCVFIGVAYALFMHDLSIVAYLFLPWLLALKNCMKPFLELLGFPWPLPDCCQFPHRGMTAFFQTVSTAAIFSVAVGYRCSSRSGIDSGRRADSLLKRRLFTFSHTSLYIYILFSSSSLSQHIELKP